MSQPFAYVEIDGREMGETPMWRETVPEGRHRVVAVTADGRRKVMQVVIEAGRETRRRLTW